MKILLTILLMAVTAVSLTAKELKVLMIGNSFSRSVHRYLPEVVDSVPDCKLKMVAAIIPSANWGVHIGAIKKAEKQKDAKPYRLIYRLPGENPRDWWRPRGYDKLDKIIKSDKWAIISIHGFRPEPFSPSADKLIAYIKKHAPDAEIVIQETWSFHCDDRRIAPPTPKWGVNQKEMSDQLSKSYRQLANDKQLRIIPVGLGVELYRKESPIRHKPYTKNDLTAFKYPKRVPLFTGDPVGSYNWQRRKDGGKELRLDGCHLNDQGHYLQACIWFSFLFNRPVADIAFTPKEVDKKTAAFTRQIAQQAIDRTNERN